MRFFMTVLAFLLVVGFAGSQEGLSGELKKVTGSVSSRVGPDSAGQMNEQVGPTGENPMTGETDSSKKNVSSRLDVTVGQEFSITLASNPTTGYHWELATSLDEPVVKLLANEFKASGTGMLGAGGQEIWTFRAMSRGQTVVQLKYVRPWEKDVAPDETASYEVIVH
jgi:inhibitor of cysteine peptidase